MVRIHGSRRSRKICCVARLEDNQHNGECAHREAVGGVASASLFGEQPFGAPPVVTAFLRIATNARLNRRPLTLKEAVERVLGLKFPRRAIDRPVRRYGLS